MGLSAIPGLPLWAAILISALFAATICIVVSLAIERFGGIVGGLLGSLPLNVIPPALGLWLQFRFQGSPFHDPFLTATGLENFQRGLISIIGGMLLNVPFLLMWQHLPSFIGTRFPSWAPSRVLAAVLVISISCWILLAIGIVSLLSSLNPQALATGNAAPISAPVLPEHLVALYGAAAAITAAMIIVGVIVGWSSPPAPKGKASVPFPQLLLRGCLAACAIGASVALGQVSSYAAGVAAPFPVIFTVSLASVFLSSGSSVSTGAICPLLLGASSNAVFSLVACLLTGSLGFGLAAVISFVAGFFGVSAPSYFYLQWRNRVLHRGSGDHTKLATGVE
ncbi:hypothetical protein BCR44DRAFT_131248 [Catenaria anguillulae PL171]|uniref:Uncharacterized protein n=1 Tax=Catenaria anguillulae PL171 TaxID=765915 RepID=A0A1Y2I167_9FUNG|nr:hypothetical protein BCR44DRAFT_131248 [Catenaria anguillulae PL171]